MKRIKTSIQGKLLRVIQLINGAVLLLTCTFFFTYEYVSFKQARLHELESIAKIIASNTTAAIAFDDRDDAREILQALQAESRITLACLYDADGKIFAVYPENTVHSNLPEVAQQDGFEFTSYSLEGFQSVSLGSKRLGTLYLQYSIEAFYERLQVYSILTLVIIVLSSFLAYFLYRHLQNSISKPILALAGTAQAVSERQDFSVRALKENEDEVGLLTDAFNHMLNRIQEQTSALNESSERLRGVLDAALSGVVVMDDRGTVIDWNDRAEKIFGWSKEEVLGNDLASLIIPEEFREAHHQGLKHFLKTGHGPVINQLLEITALRKDGAEFPGELSISVLRTNNVLTFCGFITDITERKKIEEEVRSFNQKLEKMVVDRTAELEEVNKELESFSYSVSHDLRAPLRSIHGYVTILEEEYASQLDDEAKRLIHIILRNGKRMGQLIDDLLAFSRLGRKELSKTTISMRDIVESIVDEHKRAEDSQAVKFTLKELPSAIADSTTLRQVWFNLISNAIKYSRNKEKPTVEIGSFKEGTTIIYYVRDNGAGFDMQYYDKLFGVFQRLHSHNEFEGTGVGLALVHRVISKHRGKIWAISKVDEGATFYFTLDTPSFEPSILG